MLTLAASPVSWGVDHPDTPANPDWQTVLQEVEASGLRVMELGPFGYLPTGEKLRAELARRSLGAAGTFLVEDFHDEAARERILSTTRVLCNWVLLAAGKVLVLIDRPSLPREQTAGRGVDAQRLSPRRWAKMISTVEHVAATVRSFGLTPVFHPHAGSFVEFADEIERFTRDTDLCLCLDTGHQMYAGIDPVEAVECYGPRISHMHFKDIDPGVLTQVIQRHAGFSQAVGLGIFRPLGHGNVDFAAVIASLTRQGYRGYAVLEQDRIPGTGEPLADLVTSVTMLTSILDTQSRQALPR